MQQMLFPITTPHYSDSETLLPDGQLVVETYPVDHPPRESIGQVVIAARTNDTGFNYESVVVFTRWLDEDKMLWVYENGMECGRSYQAARTEAERRVYLRRE